MPTLTEPPAHKLLIAFWLILGLLPNTDLMPTKDSSGSAQ